MITVKLQKDILINDEVTILASYYGFFGYYHGIKQKIKNRKMTFPVLLYNRLKCDYFSFTKVNKTFGFPEKSSWEKPVIRYLLSP